MSSTLLALKNAEVFWSSSRLDNPVPRTYDNSKNPDNSVVSSAQPDDLFSERGFVFGDGYFDTARFENHRVPLWELHRNRILSTAKRLAYISTQEENSDFQCSLDLSYERVCKILRAHNLDLGLGLIIKFIITGGELSLGSYSHPDAKPNIYVVVRPLLRPTMAPDATLRLSLLPIPHNRIFAGIKHLSRSNYILSARYALGKEFKLSNRQVLFLDPGKNLIECMNHNLFIVSDGVLKTPKLDLVGVNGVMRQWLLNTLQCDKNNTSGFPKLEECDLTTDSLCEADEVFISNAVDGLVRVKKLEIPTIYKEKEPLDIYPTFSQGMAKDFRSVSYNTSVTPVFDMLHQRFSAEFKENLKRV